MSELLHLLQGSYFLHNASFQKFSGNSFVLLQQRSCFYHDKCPALQKNRRVRYSPIVDLSAADNWEAVDHAEWCSVPRKAKFCDEELESLPHIQTLRKYPKEEISGRVVMVRFDSVVLLQEKQVTRSLSVTNAISTIKYVYEAGAKVILLSNWSAKINSKFTAVDSVAGILSSLLQLKVVPVKFEDMQSMMEDSNKYDILLLENLSHFKGERANCLKFSKQLSSRVDIFVNDSFYQSHKILASTVGITCFCYASVAGFHFEEGLNQLKRIIRTDRKPFFAIVGGGDLSSKATALCFLASRCDGLVFVGHMAFQMMHALGLPILRKMLEQGALEEALKVVNVAKSRGIPILYPRDFWCMNDYHSDQLEIYRAHCIPDGWQPVDIGPESVNKMTSLLTKCKKILWLGPVKFNSRNQNTGDASSLGLLLDQLSQGTCDITMVGNMGYESHARKPYSVRVLNLFENASVVWEFLKGRINPAVMALDRAFPFKIDWHATYADPTKPLAVDIGSGNGMFLFRMARKRGDLNLLGLEINKKLVNGCLDHARQSGLKNGYFIATNATTTFRSIVSSYPGDLVLVSIQCPNPDFNKPEQRWRMLQKSLVEAIVDLLRFDGKVFLQSDIEEVAERMKEQFIEHGKGKLGLVRDHEHAGGKVWLKENPFQVQSDWERHVIDKGAPMYRLLFYKLVSPKRMCSL